MTFDFRDLEKLNVRQRAFAEEYILDMNASAAGRRAGYSNASAAVSGYKNLANPIVQAYIAHLQEERSKRLDITPDDVLRKLWAIASVDANELVQYRRGCCRYCYGEGHRYQWTAAEYERATYEAERSGFMKPSAPGGNDYDRTQEPNPECPECRGEGSGEIFAQDTRNLSSNALEAYAGVKSGRDGLEIKVHDKMKALEMVGRHLGMFKDKTELSGKVEAPVLNLTLTSPDAVKPPSDSE
jgi:phage terminase small subunit